MTDRIRSVIDFFPGLNGWYLVEYMLEVECGIREWLNYGVLLWVLGDIGWKTNGW